MNSFVELIPVIVLVLWAVAFLSKEFRKTMSTFISKDKKDCGNCGCGPVQERTKSTNSQSS